MGVSTLSTTSYENISNAVPDGSYAMQLYVYKERNLSVELIKRAERAGYKAIIMTVDTPILGKRIADVKNKFKLPSNLSLENYDWLDIKNVDKGLMGYISENILNSLSWDDIAWVRSVTQLPIYLKGFSIIQNITFKQFIPSLYCIPLIFVFLFFFKILD